MDLTEDSPCIIGSSCRLPGEIIRTDGLWDVFDRGNWEACSTLPPASRGFDSFQKSHSPSQCRGGWLGVDGIEEFDAHFFGISQSEALNLRPNTRLALELTWEALENAGIPPSSIRGKNVSVSIGVGTEDGWDLRRVIEDGTAAFDTTWASNSDPSGVAGHIAHIFDFCGPCNTVSNACASGAFAIKEGIHSLLHEDSEVAIVGSLATHFTPAPFGWAVASRVASTQGRSSTFSPEADGYSPSEGAVFFVMKRHSVAISSGDYVQGIFRSIATGHNGATRTLMTPNTDAQTAIVRKALNSAHIAPGDISLLEAHGTGTPVGDALEAEGIRTVFGDREGEPLFLSSSKTVVGHCHGSAALVGLLKVLCSLECRKLPRHAVSPRAEFTRGPIIVPKNPVPLNATRLIAQVNSFGFTGSICSMIIESPVHTTCPPPNPSNEGHRFFLPFSAKTQSALFNQVVAVCSWALKTNCSLADLAAILGLCRDHHAHRHSASVVYPEDLIRLEGDAHSHSLDEQTGKAMAFPDDDRITLRLLNLSGVDESMRDGLLDEMVQSGRLVDAATLLYNRGHHLHFSAVYNKHYIDMKMLRAFPLYPFDRQRYWRDGHPRRNIDSMATLGLDCPTPNGHPSISDTKSPDSSSKQKEFLSLIEQFGAPVSFDDTPKLPREEGSFHILLTGGNGMLGSNLLARLLRHNSTTVYCIVRGQDPWSKLSRSFKVHHLDEKLLLMARESGSLVLLPTSDLCGPKLGLTDAHYQQLIESVDHIVHAAWKVNFNLPLKEFVPFLECTRALAELSLTAKKLVRYLFIGTYASTFNYSDRLVPEDILEPLVSFAAAQGYAVSKLIAENALLKVLEASLNSFELAIVRVGQICGDSVSGYWSPDEMMPMMIASLPTLKALPRSMPDVSWIPSDVCADSLRDFILFHAVDITVIPPNPHILHVANPRITPWPTVAKQLGNVAGINQIALLPFADYVPLLQRIPKDLPIVRLLPFFLESLYEGTMRENYASLNVESTLHYSQSLSACPEIGPKILRTIWRHLQSKGQAVEMQKLADPMYIFGPWSALSQEVPLDKNLTRIKALAQTVRASLDDNIDEEDLALERQLKTLACHLTEVEKLSNHGTNPCAVLGYCFGEYSAAVVSGAISEEAAVNIIVRRAIALRKVNGAMLNVFSDMNVVKRHLARLPSPPSIAIHAGPGHVVLSGTTSQIQDAQKELQRHSVKTVLIPDALPFHSDAVNGSLSKLLPYSFLPQPASTCYISCVTGSSISGIQLGVKYWLRHMREPVQFYRSMQFIRNTFPSVKIIDIGPGTSLAKMISRYEWPDTAVLSPDEWCRDVCSYSKSTPITAPTKAPQLDNMPRSLALAGERKHGKEQDLSHVALSVLSETFGYPESTDVLGRSPHSVGLQSMDFIRFSDIFSRRTGIDIPLSAFVSDLTLEKIIINAAT